LRGRGKAIFSHYFNIAVLSAAIFSSVYFFLHLFGDSGNFWASIPVVQVERTAAMLTIEVERTGDVAVVRCAGRIVRGQEVHTLRTAVIGEKDSRIVVLDLTDVESVDAGGLNTLVSLHEWARARGVQLKLVNPSHFVREMLTRTRLDRVFDISTFRRALHVLTGAECANHAASMSAVAGGAARAT
jgi:anti-anti-sigma factor